MKKLLTLLLTCTILFSNTLIANATSSDSSNTDSPWPTGPDVYSESAILMEATTGLILYEKNIDEKHYPASITKIMTSLLAIENSCLNEIVTFSKNAIFGIERDSSHIGIDVGEELTLEQSLYGIMLESANEVSYAVAEHISGDMKSFAALMNKRAKELGCTNTNFVNSNGLHDDNHYTTVHDMALIARAAINNATFRKITSTTTYIIPPTNIQTESRYLNNHHKMLKNTNYHYDGCIGGKTGYTTKSGNTLVTFAKRGNLELICVIMKSNSQNQYNDTAKLLDFGFNNFTAYDIAKSDESYLVETSPFFTRYNCIFSDLNAPIQTCSSSRLVLPISAKLKDLTKKVQITQQQSYVDGSNIVGTINYTYSNKLVGFTNIQYTNSDTPTLVTTTKPTMLSTTVDLEDVLNSVPIKNKYKVSILIFIVLAFIILLALITYHHFVKKDHTKTKKPSYRRRKSRKSFLDNNFRDFK